MFNVKKHINYTWPKDYAGDAIKEETGKWLVYLPHQCDEWSIAGEGDYGEGDTHEEAVRKLKEFIDDAQTALSHLIAKEEYKSE